MATAHKHGDTIFYSSTQSIPSDKQGIKQPEAFVQTAEKLNEALKQKPKSEVPKDQQKFQQQVIDGKTSTSHRTQPPKSVDPDPHENTAKCSEAGTCGMVETKHGKDVNMQGDKISSYGLGRKPGETMPTLEHHQSCTTGNHKQFNCNNVGEVKGLDDVNKPGRPDTPRLHTAPPRPPTPLRASTPPGSSGTPHYMQPTQSSKNKQKDRVKKTRRAIARQAYLERQSMLTGLSW